MHFIIKIKNTIYFTNKYNYKIEFILKIYTLFIYFHT